MACTGIQRRSALKRELTRLGVRYFASARGVWTTTAALEAALGLRTDPPSGRRITIGSDGENESFSRSMLCRPKMKNET